jgi:GNAT superfamily N-acetyltransferase
VATGLGVIALLPLPSESQPSRSTGVCWSVCNRGPDGQPRIGLTATLPGARGQGVGRALVDAAPAWAYDHRYQWISVDLEIASPKSRRAL